MGGQWFFLIQCVLFDAADHLLRGGQVAAVEHDDHTLAGCFDDSHLAKRGHVVHACVGARVGGKHQSFVENHANTICHALPYC